MNKTVYFFIALCAVLVSCNSSSVKKAHLSGYEYKFYVDEPGPHPSIGEYVYFQMDIYDDQNKLLQSYRNQKQMPSIKVAPVDDPLRRKNPLVDVIAALSIEDSVGIIIPRDSIPDIPTEYNYVKNLEYRIRVKEIVSEEVFQDRIVQEQEAQAQKAAENMERIPEINALMDETLAEYKAGRLDLPITQGGVKYLIHEMGTGDKPQSGWMTTVQYRGMLVSNGEAFDSSFDKGRGYTFRIKTGNAILGWHDVIPELPVGTKASIFIPSNLGYKEQGYTDAIPPNSELYFYIEIEDSFY